MFGSIVNSFALRSTGFNFYLDVSSNNTLVDNPAVNNPVGFSLSYSFMNILTNNAEDHDILTIF